MRGEILSIYNSKAPKVLSLILVSKICWGLLILGACQKKEQLLYSNDYLNSEKEVIGAVTLFEIKQEYNVHKCIFEINNVLSYYDSSTTAFDFIQQYSQDTIFRKLDVGPKAEYQEVLINLNEKHKLPTKININSIWKSPDFIKSGVSNQNLGNTNKAKAVFKFSRVSISDDLTKTCVFGEHRMHVPLLEFTEGFGRIYFLEKKSDKWIVKDFVRVWAI